MKLWLSPRKPIWNTLRIANFFSIIWIFVLTGCVSSFEQPISPKRTSTPTPRPDSYILDLPDLGVRLRLPPTWQGVQAEGPERPWVFVVPLERYGNEDTASVMSPPLLKAEEEEILIPPEPPYLLIYAYQRPPSRPWHAREVYFALAELGILTKETVEIFGTPEIFRVPRGSGWRSDLLLKEPSDEYRARLALLPMPFPRWTFVLWGMSPLDSWSELEAVYQQVLLWLDFRQTPPVTATPSDS